MSAKEERKPQKERFIEAARELGLDTPEAEQNFEATFRKIAPPLKPAAKPRIRRKGPDK